ncbi:endolytic transglycosylase MltG [Arthrobacter sp. S39]|uniref:endolytic transglycosylase MltG n=1 Tax=Arthrobacter sp. S39 TaxID=2509720 RepID=UPI001036F48C|nr:endolytic transglycosylase MltG [Arthrobacter sp. S39]TAP43980.1 endolytic transglycosylase MltG [Arthrobacter sp. S39]
MSPANIDDTSGTPGDGGARQLTRKEIRALEKSLHTESNNVVPEQAYETGFDYLDEGNGHKPAATAPPEPAAPPVVPAVPEAPPASIPEPAAAPATEAAPVIPAAPESAPAVPATPDTPPSVQQVESAPPAVEHDEVLPGDIHHDGHYPYADDAHHTDEQHHYEDGHPEAVHYDAVHADAVHYEDAHYANAHPTDTRHDADYHPDDHHDAGLLGGASAVTVVPGPSKKVRRRRRLLALFLTLVVFVTAVAVGAQFLKPLLGNDKASDFPGPGTGEVQVSVEPGEGTRSMAAKLESEKVVANADTFLQAFTASGGVLSPGDYTFKMEMKNSDAVNVLLGQDKSKVIYFALSAGLRIGESLQAISEGSGIPLSQLTELSNTPAEFGLPGNAKNLEGFLAPGEYRFPLGTPIKDILQSLVKVTVDELVAQGITDPAKQYEAVIVASIVQAEGGQAEYGDVAGAIYNRLKPNDQTNGYLQVDSAVTYGLGTKSFNFTDAERQDKSNLYNTYANPGLPPGPIGSPGKTAIDAAARPKTNDYLYWVTINLDTKETKFSKTLAEHNVYVDQYNTWCEAHAGRCA